MHEHTECEHEIKYCKVCDVCYCEMCKKEWKFFITTFTQPYFTYGDGTSQWWVDASNHTHGVDLKGNG